MELRLHLAWPAGLSLKCPQLPVALGSLRTPPGQGLCFSRFLHPKARPGAALPALQTPRSVPVRRSPVCPRRGRAALAGSAARPGPIPGSHPGRARTHLPRGPAPRSPRPAAGAAPAATSSCPHSGAGQGGGSSIPRRPPSCRGGTCSLTGTGGEGRRGWGREKPLARAPSQPSPPPPAPGLAPTGHAGRGGRRRPQRRPARALLAPRRPALPRR